jgi:hypothetical protein
MTLSMPRTISSTQSVTNAMASSAGPEAAISTVAPNMGMRMFESIERLLTWVIRWHHEIRRPAVTLAVPQPRILWRSKKDLLSERAQRISEGGVGEGCALRYALTKFLRFFY